MFLRKIPRLRESLALRMTCWYTLIFSFSVTFFFLVFYFFVALILQRGMQQDTLNDIQDYSKIFKSRGIEELEVELEWDSKSDGVENIFYRLLTPSGKTIFKTDMSSWKEVDENTELLKKVIAGDTYAGEILQFSGHEYKTYVAYGTIGPGIILQFGETLEEMGRFLALLRHIFIPLFFVTTLFALLAGWFMGRKAISGIETITATARQIAEGDFDQRVRVNSGGDEVDRLGSAFNHMVERVNILIKELKEINDYIAHDLRSPLARIRGAAELSLTIKHSLSEYQAMAANTMTECDRLLSIINTMLDITEAEAGAIAQHFEELDLVALIKNAYELFQPVAEDKNLHIIKKLPENCVFLGDARKLQRMVANLLDNALKYTSDGGRIEISLEEKKNTVVIVVSDNGVGIPEEVLPHIFKRFRRGDQSRTQNGSGLGLSLVQAIVTFHRGQIQVDSRENAGSRFTVILPHKL